MKNSQTKKTVRKIFIDYLKKHGHRKTPERFGILDEIYSRTGHFDVESLYIFMKYNKYQVSKATIYNTIGLLIDCNLIIKHQFGNSIAQYETAHQCSQHDHLINTDNGKVIEFCDPRIHEIIKTACEINNFKPLYHSLYIYGIDKDSKKD